MIFLFTLFGSKYVIENWFIENKPAITAVYWQEAVVLISNSNISLDSIQGINAERLTLYHYKTRFYIDLSLNEKQKNILYRNIAEAGWNLIGDKKYVKLHDNLKLYLTITNIDTKHIEIYIGPY